MATFYGKEIKLNGEWYDTTIEANNYREAVTKFNERYIVGRKSPYGPVVQGIRGRFVKREGF